MAFERRSDGGLQWVRPLAPRVVIRERARGEDQDRYFAPEIERERVERDRVPRERIARQERVLQDIPSFPEIEHLLGIYVATGEGRGAFLAAKMAEEANSRRRLDEDFLGRQRRRREGDFSDSFSDSSHGPDSPPKSPRHPSGGSSPGPPHHPPERTDSPSHSHLGQDHEPKILHGSHGGAQPDASHDVHLEETERRPRRDDRVWIPLQVPRDRRLRFLRVREYDPHWRGDYVPYWPGAAYFDGPPRPIVRRRPPQVVVEEVFEEIIIEGPHPEQNQGVQTPPHNVHPPERQYDRQAPRPDEAEESDDSEEEPSYADLPAEERDYRTLVRSERPARHQMMTEVHEDRLEVQEERRRVYRDVRAHRRGGYGSEHDLDEVSSDRRGRHFIHLRGGNGADNPGKMSSVGANVSQTDKPLETKRREIRLYFYSVSRGKILSSGRAEKYTTFLELRNRPPILGTTQTSDLWFVRALHLHYDLIDRQRQEKQGIGWSLVRLKTIGFASFIRFQRSVEPHRDRKGFIVTGKVPAVSAEGAAVSQFRYMMKYPLTDSKMMLFILDKLVAETKWKRPAFYVVEIKETVDTTKIYVLFGLLILISTGGGVAYAVVKHDPGTGLSIASYILTVSSLVLALVAAGEWLGLSKPDSFSFSYDVEEKQIVGATHVEAIVGRNALSNFI